LDLRDLTSFFSALTLAFLDMVYLLFLRGQICPFFLTTAFIACRLDEGNDANQYQYLCPLDQWKDATSTRSRPNTAMAAWSRSCPSRAAVWMSAKGWERPLDVFRPKGYLGPEAAVYITQDDG
jgi:hypothetical protein